VKVFLLNPPTSFHQLYGDGISRPSTPYTTPLGILHIASFIREHGHKVRILDLQPRGTEIASAVQQVMDFDPDCRRTVRDDDQLPERLELADTLKGAGLQSAIVLGGAHVTAVPTQTMRAFDTVGLPASSARVKSHSSNSSCDIRTSLVANVQGVAWRDAAALSS